MCSGDPERNVGREDGAGGAEGHPGDRSWEPEDPMFIESQPVPGDPSVMLDCLVEEFARMGLDPPMIEQLFDEPFFQATHALKEHFSAEEIRERIRRKLGAAGVLRFKTVYPECYDRRGP